MPRAANVLDVARRVDDEVPRKVHLPLGGIMAAVQPVPRGIPIGENEDGSSIYPEDAEEESRKGKLGLVCAHPLCSCHPARWLAQEPDGFGLAGVYYCDGCAADMNRRAAALSPDRQPACVKA